MTIAKTQIRILNLAESQDAFIAAGKQTESDKGRVALASVTHVKALGNRLHCSAQKDSNMRGCVNWASTTHDQLGVPFLEIEATEATMQKPEPTMSKQLEQLRARVSKPRTAREKAIKKGPNLLGTPSRRNSALEKKPAEEGQSGLQAKRITKLQDQDHQRTYNRLIACRVQAHSKVLEPVKEIFEQNS